jgi:hypothetical protein
MELAELWVAFRRLALVPLDDVRPASDLLFYEAVDNAPVTGVSFS